MQADTAGDADGGGQQASAACMELDWLQGRRPTAG